MFDQLTKYLVWYNSVSIPEVGNFKLMQESARLDIADKLIYPPSYFFQQELNDRVSDHQAQFLAKESDTDPVSVQEQLRVLGKELKRSLSSKNFTWSGVGVLENGSSSVSFHTRQIFIEGLQPIIANKVLRENVQHTVLVGEREMLKGGLLNEIIAPGKRKKIAVVIGWILVALAIAFIIFYLYQGGFQSLSSGTRMKAVPAGTSK